MLELFMAYGQDNVKSWNIDYCFELGRVNEYMYTESLKHVRIKLSCIKDNRKRMGLLLMVKPLRLNILGKLKLCIYGNW